MLDLTDRDVAYEVEVSRELDIGRVFATSVAPLEELLENIVDTGVEQTAIYRISGKAVLAFGQTLIEAGCDGFPPSGCGNRLYCSYTQETQALFSTHYRPN